MSRHGLLAEKKRTRYFALSLPNLASGRKNPYWEKEAGKNGGPAAGDLCWLFPGFNSG